MEPMEATNSVYVSSISIKQAVKKGTNNFCYIRRLKDAIFSFYEYHVCRNVISAALPASLN